MNFISYNDRADLQITVDREDGVYLGHPTTCMLADGRTVLAVYPKCHGFGQLVLKKSTDGGRTWSHRLPVPDSFSTGMECPTMFRLTDAAGKERVLLFTGRYPFRIAVSEDGEHFTDFAPIGDFGGMFIGTMIAHGGGRYTALFHDEGEFIRGGSDVTAVVLRAGSGDDVRTKLIYRRGGKEYPYWKPTCERPGDVWEEIYTAGQSDKYADGRYELYAIDTADGGLTWSAPRLILTHPEAKLCEPCAVRSPDGREIAVLLRENARKFRSMVITSRDEGRTWSEPREVCAALTGDRHAAVFLPDGRLFVSLRDRCKGSDTFCDWVAWVGSYEDMVNGGEGDCRILMKKNYDAFDCAYPALEMLADGTLLATTYGGWEPGVQQYILSLRLNAKELQKIPRKSEQVY